MPISTVLPQLPFIALGRDISEIPGDEQTWKLSREWFRTCLENHKECGLGQNPSYYPPRLLHLVHSKQSESCLRLIDTATEKPTARYVTLSHCWGRKTPVCTTSKNLKSHGQGIKLTDLPPLFQDFITVAKMLDIGYVWIDSLCILQNVKADWARHAESMDKIYEHALFTVAAVSSADSSEHFLGAKVPNSERSDYRSMSFDVEQPTGQKSTLRVRQCSATLYPGFIMGPLEERAWTWQERELSPRTINFTREEMRWVCKASQECECARRDRSSPQGKELEPSQAKLSHDWKWEVVSPYSKRAVRFPSDRLPALSGYASRFQARVKSEYMAGSWSFQFPSNLSWYIYGRCDCDCDPAPEYRSPLDNNIPSWSWASVTGGVFWGESDDTFASSFEVIPIHSLVELIDVKCNPSTANTYGEVEKGGYIEVKGKVVEARLVADSRGCAGVYREGHKPQVVHPDCYIVPDQYEKTSSLIGRVKHLMSASSSVDKDQLLRRAMPHERADRDRLTTFSGTVTCLLLYWAETGDKKQSRVLILGRPTQSEGMYQRLGIGGMNTSYENRKHWRRRDGWDDLEEWTDWEAWFADGETRTLRIG